MKKVVLFLLLLPACLPALGRQGHQTVALMAQGLLTPGARRLVNWLRRAPGWRKLKPGHGARFETADRELTRFCRGKSLDLGLAADWADDWRLRHSATNRVHSVETPLDSDGGVDAMKAACGGDCILTQLRTQIRVLNDSDAGRLRRLQALLWIVNLMGDLHQPLRCADNRDRGGAAVRVSLRGRRESLRHAWDSGILAAEGVRPRRLAGLLLANQRHRPWNLEAVDERSPWVWATETFWVAKNSVYPQLRVNHGYYDQDEVAKAWPVMRMQLARGGVRLAEVLNTAAAK